MPAAVLAALSTQHDVAAVVQPGQAPSWRGRIRGLVNSAEQKDPFSRLAQKLNIPVERVASGTDPEWSRLLNRTRPDIICVASFPWLLRTEIFSAARCGAVNLHTSLLPRRRGPSPMFWVYYFDDRVSGVTIHRVTARADQGAILAQEEISVPRGMRIGDLYNVSTEKGARLMPAVVDSLIQGADNGFPQDESAATKEPRVPPGKPMVDFPHWPVERVWHFLRGLCPHFLEPLKDQHGDAIRYLDVGSFQEAEPVTGVGTALTVEGGWHLQCKDGWVHLLNAVTSRI